MIRPLRDLLVLRAIGAPPGKFGLIHIPDTGLQSQATGCYAEVVAAGPKAVLATVGSKVYVKAYGSHPACETEIEHEGETLYVDRERNILGVVT